MSLTSFQPISKGTLENKNSIPVIITFLAKTSDIRNFSRNNRHDVKTSDVALLKVNH